MPESGFRPSTRSGRAEPVETRNPHSAITGFTYRPRVLEELARHGVIPGPATPPALAHGFVNDLYRYELRKLRGRLMRGQIPKRAYADHVIALRKKYILVSVPLHHWTETQYD